MIGAAIRKDVRLLLHDRGALVSLFALPVIFMLAFGSMFRFGPDSGKPRSIAVWHAPDDVRGLAIASVLDQTAGFVAKRVDSPALARQLVVDEVVVAALIVPAGSTAASTGGSTGGSTAGAPARDRDRDRDRDLAIDLAIERAIEVAIDTTSPSQVRGPILGALTGVVLRASSPAAFASAPPIVVVSPPGLRKPLANISSFQVTVPGNAVLFGFFIALTVAMAFTSERKTGTWRRLLSAPVPRWKALVATLVPYYLVGCVQLAFLFGVGFVGFGLQVAGSVVALVAISLGVVACAVSLGLLMAAIGGSERQLGGVGSVCLLVMGMLGGCMVPRLVMPAFMQQLGLAVPHSWALDGYYAVLVREGTTLAEVAPSLAALFGFAIGFTGLGLALFRFEK